MRYAKCFVLAIAASASLGAGCGTLPATQHTAQTFKNLALEAPVAITKGFGELPKINIPTGRATVKLTKELPKLPSTITVLRLRKGTPDDAVLRSVTKALNIPAAMLGNVPQATEMSLDWKDDQGFRWSYRASERTLEFWNTATSGPLTISALEQYDKVMATANSFIFSRGLTGMYYRQGLVRPDWYQWWTDAVNRKLCMDADSLNTVRALAASNSLVSGSLPGLVPAAGGTCVEPSFPSRQVIVYRALIDEQDVVRPDGSYFDGAEIAVDTSRNTVSAGRLNMYYDPERSDYPALPKDKVLALLTQGGLSGAIGEMTMTDFDFVFLRLDDERTAPNDIYLIPSILAKGTRTLADGQTSPFTIVVPLLAQ